MISLYKQIYASCSRSLNINIQLKPATIWPADLARLEPLTDVGMALHHPQHLDLAVCRLLDVGAVVGLADVDDFHGVLDTRLFVDTAPDRGAHSPDTAGERSAKTARVQATNSRRSTVRHERNGTVTTVYYDRNKPHD